jgi:hypothetical protein
MTAGKRHPGESPTSLRVWRDPGNVSGEREITRQVRDTSVG